jgi:hypothetical protein
MTSHNQDELIHALATELDGMSSETAERLTTILRGLFTCMQDLNQRVSILEGQRGGPPGAEN